MILAIDQGTTGSTCFVFDEHGQPAGRAYSEFEQHFPRPGWVEHDAAEIWAVTERVANEALNDAGVKGEDLDGIGITNQRETAVAWDRESGEPLHRAIVWQDRRTAGFCDRLREQGHEPMFRERTGLVLDAYFSGTKYRWLLDEGGVDKRALLGTIDSWLVYKLCGEHVTDFSNASRTLLFNIRDGVWDEELCDLLSVPIGVAARAARQRAGVRQDERVRRQRAGLRHGGRPAGRPVRPGLPRAGPGQEHLRHGQLPAPERGRGLTAARAGPDHHDRLEAGRAAWSTRSSRACS